MNVFISWSGKMSGELAKVLRDWLPSVIQAVKPYFSTDDIEKGTRGNTMLAKELEEASIGILCLTRENLEAPWIMFEAGTLSKSLDNSRVCPILFGDLGTTDLKGPLTNFQAAKFNKEEMRKVIATINLQLGDSALGPKTLETVFEKWWLELEQKVKKILSSDPKDTGEKIRNDREIIEETLTLVRQISETRGYKTLGYTEATATNVTFHDFIIEDLLKHRLTAANIKLWAQRWFKQGITKRELESAVSGSKTLPEDIENYVKRELRDAPKGDKEQ